MNTLLVSTVAVTLASSVALSSNAQANPEFYGADETPGTALCLAITKDHPRALRKEMQSQRVNRYVMDRKLSCNNLTVQEFASFYGFERSLNTLGIAPMTNTSIKDLAKRVDTNSHALVGSR